ncbi:MAG: hypothetical protein QY306_16080 [Anaerolineales bacterium]|nr:MAG: hypothetical protein QY306_16080 [Anaerolineales bacterium]
MERDYKQLVREKILGDGFIRATFSGEQKSASLKWKKAIVRPVEVRGEIRLQFSYFDEKKDITKIIRRVKPHQKWMNCSRSPSETSLSKRKRAGFKSTSQKREKRW